MPVLPVAPRNAATTRRTALGGVLASLAAVSACDLDRPDDAPSLQAGSRAGSRASSAQAAPDDDPDGALVDEVLVELAELTALVTGVGARFPALAAPMRALGDLHDAHREALDAGSDTGPDTGPVTGRSPAKAYSGPADALLRVRSRERVAQRRLSDWAVAARSGALARLLACMSAGVAQQLVVLPATAGADR